MSLLICQMSHKVIQDIFGCDEVKKWNMYHRMATTMEGSTMEGISNQLDEELCSKIDECCETYNKMIKWQRVHIRAGECIIMHPNLVHAGDAITYRQSNLRVHFYMCPKGFWENKHKFEKAMYHVYSSATSSIYPGRDTYFMNNIIGFDMVGKEHSLSSLFTIPDNL